MVGRGRTFFRMGLGDEGYASHVEAMKEEARRRRSMSEVEREAEDLAEAFGITYEDALRRVEEERDLSLQRRGARLGLNLRFTRIESQRYGAICP